MLGSRRTIFGGTVNIGVATLAYCSELLERAFGPAALLRPGARLEYKGIRPIRAGYEITNYFNLISQPRLVDDLGPGKFVTRPANLSLEGLFVQNNAHALVEIARSEKDPEMKREAVQKLSVMGHNKEAAEYLMELLKD